MPAEPEFTTFSRDVFGRFSCNTWDEATGNPDGIDVVVLGSGMYGGYCASKIFELSRAKFDQRALRVVVLEAGPFLIPEHGQNIPNFGLNDPGISNTQCVGSGANPETRNLVWGVGWRSNAPFVGQAYCVGGKGLFWGGWCPRLQASDLAQWPEEVREYFNEVDVDHPVGLRPIHHTDPATGEMLHRDDPLSGYETLEYEVGVQPSDDFVFDPTRVCDCDDSKIGLNGALHDLLNQRKADIDPRITEVLLAPIAVQTQAFVSGLFSLDKYSSLPALVGSTRLDHGNGRPDNLRIATVPFAHVVRLECEANAESPSVGTRVVRAVIVKVDGEFRRLEIQPHCQVVLAMSSIESTRLALESFSLESSMLRAAGQELMGRNAMVHLRCDIAFDVERSKLAEYIGNRFPGKSLAEVLQLAALHVQCEGSHGRYQFQLFAATNENGPDANMYRMIPDLDIQRKVADQFHHNMVRLVLRASGEVAGGRGAPLNDPAFDYINLAGDNDFDHEFGHRRAWVQFKQDQHVNDGIWQDIHDTGHAIAAELANGGSLTYQGGPYFVENLRTQQGVGTTFHDAGTLWMGDHPDSSVTDVNGHFHHVTNAYACDQSLFTTVGSANPVLTGLVLARKVATNIVDRHDSHFIQPKTGFTPQSLMSSAGWKQTPYSGMAEIGMDMVETQPTAGLGIYYLQNLFDDFELQVEWKAFRTFNGAGVTANSGIMLRMPDPSEVNFADPNQLEDFYARTTEIQIDETGKNFNSDRNPQAIFGDSRFKTGAIYGLAPATRWAAKVAAPDGAPDAQYWNTFHITAIGARILVNLNGRDVSMTDVTSPKRTNGHIGLQFHTGRVQFRNLQIRRR